MKKKGLLGIIALIMVIALALTGCGQQGEQNAEAIIPIMSFTNLNQVRNLLKLALK